MREQLERRLDELKEEFESGQKMLAEVEARGESLRQSLLRISGAIQVLEEELSKAEVGKGKVEEAGASPRKEDG